MTHFHAIVWIDHREAKIYEVGGDGIQKLVIRSQGAPAHHIHHKAGSIGAGHAADDEKYWTDVCKALHAVGEVVVVGPGNAKTSFTDFAKRHDKPLASKIVGVESADHPSDGDVIEFARKYFRAKDRMLPQRPNSKPH